ncbi:ribonuclease H-like domain-containing protein [Tanacetum coccineum]
MTHPHPKAVLLKSSIKTLNTAGQNFSKAAISVNAARPINTAYPRPTVNSAWTTSNVFNRAHSHGNPQLELQEKGVIDSGCSRHMTGNKSYLSDYEEIDGGFVAFGGDPKGGKITGKGKISTGKLDFEDVYFVKELKVPRKDNMYSVDLKNIVPSGGLTCLFAKATLDESNLWHKRLGHINFKTMNKLVRGNLVRGLPSKIFENTHTCVACQKGKQHKVSCRKPTLSFMRPFGCPDTILNTIDHLGKFDGKADEGFFLGYSTNSKAFRVKLERRQGGGKKDAKDLKNEDSEVPNTEESRVNQELDANVNSTNNINIVSPTVNAADIENNAIDENIVYGCVDDLNMPNLEEIVYSDDDEGFDVKADMTNLDTHILVSHTLTTRIHKDHPLE